MERIAALRTRNSNMMASLDRYEQLVEDQSAQLARMHGVSSASLDDEADEELVASGPGHLPVHSEVMTEEDLRREEGSIAELEQKKRTLEERVSGIEKDLSGLMR